MKKSRETKKNVGRDENNTGRGVNDAERDKTATGPHKRSEDFIEPSQHEDVENGQDSPSHLQKTIPLDFRVARHAKRKIGRPHLEVYQNFPGTYMAPSEVITAETYFHFEFRCEVPGSHTSFYDTQPGKPHHDTQLNPPLEYVFDQLSISSPDKAKNVVEERPPDPKRQILKPQLYRPKDGTKEQCPPPQSWSMNEKRDPSVAFQFRGIPDSYLRGSRDFQRQRTQL